MRPKHALAAPMPLSAVIARLRSWLLVLVLLAAQAAMLAHGAEHVGAGDPAHPCLVCLAGHGAASAAPPPIPLAIAAASLPQVFVPAWPAGTVSPVLVSHPARGPPRA